MLQLTRGGVVGSADIPRLASAFTQRHTFRMPGLLHPDLMRFIIGRMERSPWVDREDVGIAKELVPSDPSINSVLNFALNAPEFLAFMRQVTGCEEIVKFSGRVYRMTPGGDHYDSWHSDLGDKKHDRLIGMSINLGALPYEGGVFQLREESTKSVLCELPNTTQSDAIFFRISPALKHMVSVVSGTEPKTAFAGWFRSGQGNYYSDLLPDFLASS